MFVMMTRAPVMEWAGTEGAKRPAMHMCSEELSHPQVPFETLTADMHPCGNKGNRK